MAHSLITPPPSTTCTTPISINSKPCITTFQRACASHQSCKQVFTDKLSTRRNVCLGLVGVVLGSSVVGDWNAYAAARRPPPPPPEEKKDPNVSGVQAKVLASKKRKEAMKQAVAKLREKGKAVNEPSSE